MGLGRGIPLAFPALPDLLWPDLLGCYMLGEESCEAIRDGAGADVGISPSMGCTAMLSSCKVMAAALTCDLAVQMWPFLGSPHDPQICCLGMRCSSRMAGLVLTEMLRNI